MPTTRLKQKDILPVKLRIAAEHGHKCGICGIPLQAINPKDWCLDHDHNTGQIRDVLCRNCNGIEGKVYNLMNRAKRKMSVFEWGVALLRYWKRHLVDQYKLVHPTHKTDDEKRIARNAKARKKRALTKKV